MLPRPRRFDDLEQRIAPSMARVGVKTLRYGLALLYFWFGAAKIWAPGEGLALVTDLFGLIGLPSVFGLVLAVWEIIIAALFVRKETISYAAPMATAHLIGTFLPMLALPALTWTLVPWLTLHGQFVTKNIVLLGGVWVVWAATIRMRMRTV